MNRARTADDIEAQLARHAGEACIIVHALARDTFVVIARGTHGLGYMAARIDVGSPAHLMPGYLPAEGRA